MNSPIFAQRTSGNSAKAPAEPYAACGAAHGLSLPFGNSRLWPSTELYYANFSKYACACTVRTAGKPPQPIEKSIAGASLLAHVIVSKVADHLPLHRQAKMLRRHGVELSEQTMCGWMAQCAQLLDPLYARLKRCVLASKVVHGRYASEGVGPAIGASAERAHLAVCGRPPSSHGSL